MGVMTELISVPSKSNGVVDIGSHALELENLLPQNPCAFELIVPSDPVVNHKIEGRVLDDKNLIEKKSGEVEKIGLIVPLGSVVEDQTVSGTNLIEENSGKVEKTVTVVDDKVEHQLFEESGGVLEKVGLVDEESKDFVFDYKRLIQEDPWNYDAIEVDEEELKRRHPLANFVCKKRRTLRYVVGEIICNGGKDLIYYVDSSTVAKREESRKSEQLAGGKDLSYYPGSSMTRKNEELRKSKKQLRFADDEDAGPSNGIGMITKKEAARKSKRSARDPNFICWKDDEEPSKKKQKRKHVPPGPPPELPDRFRDYVDKLNLAEPPLFVAQKPFTATDMDRHQSRLSFPRARIEDKFFDNFLTEVENQMLENRKRIEVNVVDDNMHVYDTLQFTRWPMKSKNSKSKNAIYVLTKDWNRFAADHRLKENMVVQCWCFRMDSRICFCLAVNRDIEKEK